MARLIAAALLVVGMASTGCRDAATRAPDCADPERALACGSDSDCACGRSRTTGDCAFGAKACIDESRQCPDFCAGIAGKLEVVCVEGRCAQRMRAR